MKRMKDYDGMQASMSRVNLLRKVFCPTVSAPERCFSPCLAYAFYPATIRYPFNSRTWPGLQTAGIGLNAPVRRHIPAHRLGPKNARMRDPEKALPAIFSINLARFVLARQTHAYHSFCGLRLRLAVGFTKFGVDYQASLLVLLNMRVQRAASRSIRLSIVSWAGLFDTFFKSVWGNAVKTRSPRLEFVINCISIRIAFQKL
jgi:hypothetical protein